MDGEWCIISNGNVSCDGTRTEVPGQFFIFRGRLFVGRNVVWECFLVLGDDLHGDAWDWCDMNPLGKVRVEVVAEFRHDDQGIEEVGMV